ncbi:carbohydrate ABC transporter permease [Streptomyces anthocyanicus]|uniref:carbohydrate ABC transporter permease n=1 Tax=Streptomyces anthocyanicus TaxID=68174 RepID=UPI003668A51C
MQLFGEPLLFSSGAGASGGADHQYQTLGLYLYEQGWVNLHLGRAAAIAWAMLLLLVVLFGLVRLARGRGVRCAVVAGSVAVGTVLFSTLAGFAFARLRFRLRGPLLLLVGATMLVPPQLGVVPLYLLVARLGWTDQLQAVVLPSLVSAFGVFYMRQHLRGALPPELLEAARMDGAGTPRVVWHLVLPAARPAMAVLGMLSFVAAWNDFFWPVLALTQTGNPTVQVALTGLGRGYVPDTSVVMAGALLGTLPLLVVLALFGRQIVGGVMRGAVKG